MQIRRRANWPAILMTLGAMTAYSAAFVPLFHLVGPQVTAATLVVVVIAGWLLGSWGGALVALALIPINILLSAAVGVSGWQQITHSHLLGVAETVLAGVFVGGIRQQLRRSRQQAETLTRERQLLLDEQAARQQIAAALARQHAYLEALHATTPALLHALDIDAVLESIVTRAAALLDTSHGYLCLVEEAADRLRIHIAIGAFAERRGAALQRGEGLAGRVWSAAAPRSVPDYQAWAGRSPQFDGLEIGAAVGVPLAIRERLVGVLGVCYTEPERDITDAERGILVRFAELASIALEHAQLYTAARRQAQELALVDRMRSALAAGDARDTILRAAVAAVADALSPCRASIYLVEDTTLVLQHQVGGADAPERVPLSEARRGRVARTGQPVFLAPFAAEPGRGCEAGFICMVSLPLFDQQRVVGVLDLERLEGAWLTIADLKLLDVLGQQITLAFGQERLRAEAAAQEKAYHQIVETSSELIALHSGGILLYMNPAGMQLLGMPEQAKLVGRRIWEVVHPAYRELAQERTDRTEHTGLPATMIEEQFIRLDGQVVDVEVISTPVLYGGRRATQTIARDITERKQAEATIRRMAYYDTLTNLPNRRLFYDRLRQVLAQARRHEQQVAVLFLDLDRFKLINDTLGHHIGDLLLQEVAHRLQSCVRANDTVARMSGDEFTLILPDIHDTHEVTLIAQRIVDTLSGECDLDGQKVVVTTSIGITLFPLDGDDIDALVQQADTAMYRAKEGSRNAYAFYTPTMQAAALERLELEQHLRAALERDEFTVVYQPRVLAADGALVAIEALVRWRHPTRGILGPADFFTVAEETGLIVPLGDWVLRTACAQLARWRAAGWYGPRVAVNLAARQFQRADLVQRVTEILAETGLPPQLLEIEITEQITMGQADRALEMLQGLKALGVQLAMDDFGTGYSSLHYLKRFPLDTLKVDRSFIGVLPADANAAAIVRSVIALAHSLRLKVTAEGVETDAQLAFLRQHGCDALQGYLVGRPGTPDEIFDRRHGAQPARPELLPG